MASLRWCQLFRRQEVQARQSPYADNAQHAELARSRRRRRAGILTERRHRNANKSTPHDDSDPELDMIRQHFSQMRNRAPRLPAPSLDSHRGDANNQICLGVQDIDSQSFDFPSAPFELKHTDLDDPQNITCSHCNAQLWKEEKGLNCCNKGKSCIHPLQSIPHHLMALFETTKFISAQRRYNGLFGFTALGAGCIQKKTWTEPPAPSMLTLHGRAYHRIFDLQQH